MYYWTPKRLAELKAKGLKLQAAPEMLIPKLRQSAGTRNRDQAISDNVSTETRERAPGAGLKLQAASSLEPQASSNKPQARINKPQASSSKPSNPSNKLQATSHKLQAS